MYYILWYYLTLYNILLYYIVSYNIIVYSVIFHYIKSYVIISCYTSRRVPHEAPPKKGRELRDTAPHKKT